MLMYLNLFMPLNIHCGLKVGTGMIYKCSNADKIVDVSKL
jgi:hypothetical protein